MKLYDFEWLKVMRRDGAGLSFEKASYAIFFEKKNKRINKKWNTMRRRSKKN